MILHGNQRGGAKDLALHLLKDENEHVEVHELRGFISEDLVAALHEAYAVSRGTKAKQFLFSLSLNPPPRENVSTQDFEDAINLVEDKLGLNNQPRAVVFHEKEGRRHAHAVWSRTNVAEMKAVQLSHTKLKLADVSRELYIAHDWKMPRGFMRSEERDPKNFTMAQWQQAKRAGKDPREVRTVFQECWATSDTQGAFQRALKERGYTLARGDRRGFVALDHRCEVYAVPKWVGVKSKAVKAKLDEPEKLPSVDYARIKIAKDMAANLEKLQIDQSQAIQRRLTTLAQKQRELVEQQKRERAALKESQAFRQQQEIRSRQTRFKTGLKGILERVSGRRRRIEAQNEHEALIALKRDQSERDDQIFAQMKVRRALQSRINRLAAFREARTQAIGRDKNQYRDIESGRRLIAEFKRQMNSKGLEPRKGVHEGSGDHNLTPRPDRG